DASAWDDTIHREWRHPGHHPGARAEMARLHLAEEGARPACPTGQTAPEPRAGHDAGSAHQYPHALVSACRGRDQEPIPPQSTRERRVEQVISPPHRDSTAAKLPKDAYPQPFANPFHRYPILCHRSVPTPSIHRMNGMQSVSYVELTTPQKQRLHSTYL